MPSATYQQRRGELFDYFDRTAADAWKRLTSDAPVNRIRATVRAGREEMRRTLLGWLPDDLGGRRLLDAGCGTGLLALEAARRGADVLAVDLSPTLIGYAREHTPHAVGTGRSEFVVGDMLDPAFGRFDYVVAMDSLIHYRTEDAVTALARLAACAERSLLFTFAPRTMTLASMHAVGRLFPRSNRAPAIEPVAERALTRRIAAETGLARWRIARTRKITTGFYMSQALELLPT